MVIIYYILNIASTLSKSIKSIVRYKLLLYVISNTVQQEVHPIFLSYMHPKLLKCQFIDQGFTNRWNIHVKQKERTLHIKDIAVLCFIPVLPSTIHSMIITTMYLFQITPMVMPSMKCHILLVYIIGCANVHANGGNQP